MERVIAPRAVDDKQAWEDHSAMADGDITLTIDAALADPRDRRDIEIAVRSEGLNAGVSLTAGYRVFIESDEQAQAALKYFDEAAKLQARAHPGSVPVQAAAQAGTPSRP